MRLISLHWSNNTGEGSVKYTTAFNEEDCITQLDMLKDCIGDLTDRYDAILSQPEEKLDDYN